MSLAALFPEGDFRFHLTLRRGEPREFFGSSDASGRLLVERRHCLEVEPTRYAALQREGEPLLAELIQLAREWGLDLPHTSSVREVGALLEPDLLLLSPDADGAWRLRGGALCFPTGWGLDEKIGQTLDSIHGVVPGLNAALGSPLRQFLARLRPGIAYHRDNWGIAATDELNLHPTRAIPPPRGPLRLDGLWLRVEHQALVALPKSGGVLFGIRIALHRLDEVRRDADGRAGLRHALATMPDDLARYKRLDAVRSELLAQLS
jgi:hypothetical protein